MAREGEEGVRMARMGGGEGGGGKVRRVQLIF